MYTHTHVHGSYEHVYYYSDVCCLILYYTEPSHERPSQSKTPCGAGRSPARAAPHYAAPQKSSSSYNRQVRHLKLYTFCML